MLIGLSAVSATDPANDANQTNVTNVTVDPVNNATGHSVNLTANVTANGTSVTNGSVKFTVNGTNAGTASVGNNGIATLNWQVPYWNTGTYVITADFDGTGTIYANSTNTSTLTVNPTKGYWMFSSDAASLNSAKAAALESQGITDVFVCTRDVNGNYHYSELQNAIYWLHQYGINVHAWIVCFKDGNFVNPLGYYCYTIPHAYKKVKYRTTWKVAYTVKIGKGKNKRYVIRYKLKHGWAYKWLYWYETRSGYDTSYNTQLINQIAYITQNYNVDGIHLDYVRYSGVAQYGNAAWQQPGGVSAAVNAVTGFVQSVDNKVKSINPNVAVSAALMPEGSCNDYYYAQDYAQLSQYLDFLVPMTYEQNYHTNDAWITQQTSYIVGQSNGKPVYSGLMTYDGDDNPSCAVSDLPTDVQAAYNGGASGYVLFRYGIGSSDVPNWP